MTANLTNDLTVFSWERMAAAVDAVPDRDICLAISNKAKFEHDPEAHTYKE
jgi:hypothetical protein